MTTFQESDTDARSNTFTEARTTKGSVGLISVTDGLYKDELTAELSLTK